MIRAVGERRLLNLRDVLFGRAGEAVPTRVIGLFDDIAAALVASGETYREMIGLADIVLGALVSGILTWTTHNAYAWKPDCTPRRLPWLIF
ncbi:MAG: hypothetical protein QOE41_3192 [Mycobacterium sp.]|jgi:hypothetical protein|nr:TetR/AcrR family transcriptional regulator [Mycobacterium sp.]MDT5133881.1 hypothetical protein [Mycobacterium sp.]